MRKRRKTFARFLALLTLLSLCGGIGWIGRQAVLERSLIQAVQRNDTPTALLLLRQGADANVRTVPTHPLSLLQRLKQLLHRLPDTTDSRSALALAVQHNNTAIVQALVAHGANRQIS